ncbi:hypothetical protein P152DRAFT_473207 [Eremomyces bilateralis CBS 781.70]|uniref:Uncharacterized protein n=1 Tax=Eremomyces bilateralis CBS 781.70 TaxID=1392243 RepID=A0A6G1G6D5_9PEZI|nr:uncharacterized protein P152DRAFT_473207 [Eremomyces bilateralis CBS 781.70]KAF1813486.1 hypothetical protein P152DRAFT_473207 [Eremomyces bilateralis CBS 781.70]
MSFWGAYRSLTPRTRIYLGVGVIGWSALGLYFTDKWEDKIASKKAEPGQAVGQPTLQDEVPKANEA